MMEVGTYLKFHRLQKNVTQTELSVGICTPSYLSRIENNLIQADEEIYSLLFDSLGLSYKSMIQDEDDLDQRLEEWYKKMFFLKESDEDIEELKKLCKNARPHTYIKFELIYCRYLILSQQIALAKKKISTLSKLTIANKHKRIYFLYINVLMLFNYQTKKYREGLEIGKKAVSTHGFLLNGPDYEVGAFHYNLGLLYKNLYIYRSCEYHTKESLKIFLNGYYLEQAIDCHILLGISLNNTGKRPDSLESYLKAKRLLQYLDKKHHKRYLGIIEHNIGCCYQIQGEYKRAIEHYMSSLSYKKKENQLRTNINLIYCYYFLSHISESKVIFFKSLELKNENTPRQLKLQLDFFEIILLTKTLSMQQVIELENIFMEFVKLEVQEVIFYLGNILSNLFEVHHHYKSANRIYKNVSKCHYIPLPIS
ncbi:hypothetical protein [Virgibacillus halodenitrificans]|uniref:hypothetical protein n=1 Tax=Virgibacillus halodenitrificans TaxID=1482 RepID=UPI000EF5564F|nr:hypothetical protein [Virgibacillus halodenitrificans]